MTTDASALAAQRSALSDPSNWVILPEIISKEPLGPAVRQGDDAWADLVRWVLYGVIAAEEMGITSANVDSFDANVKNPQLKRMLGLDDTDLGGMLGLDKEWLKRAIKQVGNYGEIFERHIGVNTPVGLERGVNAQWTDGGLIYAPPFN
jgi:general L-amino acid transport system substrate-binding protein